MSNIHDQRLFDTDVKPFMAQFIYSLFMLMPTFVLALSQHQTCKIPTCGVL